MLFKYAQCCSIWATFHVFEQHFVYLSVNNNTHIKKTLHKVLQNIFLGGAKFILVSVTRIWRAFRWCQHFSTKHLPQSLDQTSTSKNLPMFNLKVFNENILQNHDQTLVSKPWQYLALKALTKIKVQILYQTSASKSWPNCRQHSFNISNTNNLNATQVKSVIYFNNSSQLVSEWVTQSVSDKGTQRSDLGKYNVCQHM